MKFFAPAAGWLARDVAKAAERAKELEKRPRWRCRCGRLAAITAEGWRSGLIGCPNYSGRAAHLGDTCSFLPPPLVCKCGVSSPCPYPGCWHPEKITPPPIQPAPPWDPMRLIVFILLGFALVGVIWDVILEAIK